MMHQAVDYHRCHIGVNEDAGSFKKSEIGRDSQARALVEFSEYVKQ